MTDGRKLIIIGGTGVFGRRLARHVITHGANVVDEVIVTSRNERKAKALAKDLALDSNGRGVRGIGMDVRTSLQSVLTSERPWAIVDCSGPFQSANHNVPRLAIESRAHVLDLADARDYLLGYHDALNHLAKANGVVGLAGASSTPALSGAVVRELVRGWTRIDTINLAIVPGGRSEVGQSVLQAVLSYAGQPVPIWRGGQLQRTNGWTDARMIGVRGLGKRRVATAETVDAERLGARYNVANDVTFSAGLESVAEQRGLELLARLRASGLLPNLTAFARPLHAMRRLTRLTTGDSGGMVVQAFGLNQAGEDCRATWTLLAKDGSGLHVPVLAAAAALRRLAQGNVQFGARLADEALTLDDILAEASPYPITTHSECETIGASQRKLAVPA